MISQVNNQLVVLQQSVRYQQRLQSGLLWGYESREFESDLSPTEF